MSTPITVALITGVSGLATSVLTLVMQQLDRRRADHRADEAAVREEEHAAAMRRLQAELDAGGRERDAQRDYEYEARKRLYTEVQPLFFQLAETAETCFQALVHLQGFRAFRLLEDPESPMMIITVYRLMAPISVVHLLQRRLTAVDLRLDPALRAQYRVARELPHTFRRGEEMAKLFPPIEYVWGSGPARQHLASSEIDVMAEYIILSDPDGTRRCATYPEFEARYVRDREMRELSQGVRLWLQGANPLTKPVAWRLLIAQALLLRMLVDMIESGADRPERVLTAALSEQFNWRTKAPLPKEQEADAARAAAEAYVRDQLRYVFPTLVGS